MRDDIRVTLLLDGRVLVQKRDQIIEVQPEELPLVTALLVDAMRAVHATQEKDQ